ncbi:hypothetical protein DIZ76_010018 [Coccidioides immitis]|uniref:Protein kinase domain-containing protein n=1 Tax=Coccidioides immitis RMSCC 3703 TaxID=454286 RepID=A0A0J8U422_COCIT|nr:hypothetical protein CISG_09200 [Coccidioides immitis RMSCC 3703]TPX24587.1 hypothetical protein DIZ76_010018 [Coccidioides immitis]
MTSCDTFQEDDPSLPVIEPQRPRALLGAGVTSHVEAIDQNTALKKAPLWDNTYMDNSALRDIQTERLIYQRLGHHPRICKYIRPVHRGMVLERLGDSLRKRLVLTYQKAGEVPSHELALRWSIQAAEGIAYIHSKGVLQGDIGCYNMLLDDEDNLKLCDFAGSSIDGSPTTVLHGTRSQLWVESEIPSNDNAPPTIACELFALGSAIHEIWTTRQPYEELEDNEVEKCYKQKQFPIIDLPVSEIIYKCWLEQYTAADEVVAELQQLQNNATQNSREKAPPNLKTEPESDSPLTHIFTTITFIAFVTVTATAVITARLYRTRMA